MSGPTLCEPMVAFVPDQPPDALQLVMLVPLQLSVVLVFRAALRGLADKVTEGLPPEVTVTLAVRADEPPGPAHASVKLEFAVNAPVLCIPDVPFAPDHAPDAAQLVALVVLHANCDDAPDATLPGDAVSVIVGTAEELTLTVAVRAIEPPALEHVSVYDLLAVRAPVPCVPLVPLVPVHAPEAVQEAAWAAVHDSVDDPLNATDVGDAQNERVGLTLTNVDTLFDPPAPVQVRWNATFVVIGPVVHVPDIGLVPDQLPDAVQLVALVEDHVSFEVAPEYRDVGDAVSETVGIVAASALLVEARTITTRSRGESRSRRSNARTSAILRFTMTAPRSRHAAV